MKKQTCFLLSMLLVLGVLNAGAESAVFDTLTRLMNNRIFTLTVSAESTDSLAEIIERYGTVRCDLHQEEDRIVLDAVCDGDAYLKATATADGVEFETNLIENGSFSSNWAALEPQLTETEGRISVTMTGPDHELIRFTCSVEGTDVTDCQVEIDIGYITGPGNVHSLWDGITNKETETSREFFFTFSEEEYALEGEGTLLAERGEDGGLTLSRDETCTVTYLEDELGEVIFHSVLTVR